MSAPRFPRDSLRNFQRLALLIFCCSAGAFCYADVEEVQRQLVDDIQTSQKALNRTEADISADRAALYNRINEVQRRVQALRRQSQAARRTADEQSLSLDQLERRLSSWQEQSLFQQRLLADFSAQAGFNPDTDAESAADELSDELPGLEQLEAYAVAQREQLRPNWRPQTMVMPDGEVLPSQQLQLGPISWFWLPERQQGGLLNTDTQIASAALLFDGSVNQNLGQLYSDGRGEITFDPSLSRALVLAQSQESLLQHLRKGGIWAIPILLFALFATLVAVAKAVSLWRLPKLTPALAERVQQALNGSGGDLQQIRQQVHGAQAELLTISLGSHREEQRDERLFACLLEYRQRLERWLGAIAVTASVSPLLGLLGTVSGMIATFKLMTLFGAGDPAAVSAGISEALVTTELGLIVAIPALLAHAIMSRRVKSYYAQLESNAIHLSQLTNPNPDPEQAR